MRGFAWPLYAKQNEAPTQARKLHSEVLQHLHIGAEQLFGVGDEDHLAWRAGGRRCLQRPVQPDFGNALVDVGEQSQALITSELFHRNIRVP